MSKIKRERETRRIRALAADVQSPSLCRDTPFPRSVRTWMQLAGLSTATTMNW
jgi:hypothetical protein